MTLDEKIEQLKINTLTQARKEASEIIKEQEKSIEDIKAKHMMLTKRRSLAQIDSAKNKAWHDENKKLSKSYLELRREFTKKVDNYTDEIFEEARLKLLAFRETSDYTDLLKKWIMEAKEFAEDDEIHIYLNPTDSDKKELLEKECNVDLVISAYDFIGGTRAVIRNRNVLIDHAFSSRLASYKETFHFKKGELHA